MFCVTRYINRILGRIRLFLKDLDPVFLDGWIGSGSDFKEIGYVSVSGSGSEKVSFNFKNRSDPNPG